jgi:hypothetical protein
LDAFDAAVQRGVGQFLGLQGWQIDIGIAALVSMDEATGRGFLRPVCGSAVNVLFPVPLVVRPL